MQEKVCITQSASDSDTGKGKSKMSKQIKHGYHLVEGKSGHAMEDYVFAEFRQVDENELGLFAIFDGHVSREVPKYLKSHLFNNILKEVNTFTTYIYSSTLLFTNLFNHSLQYQFWHNYTCLCLL